MIRRGTLLALGAAVFLAIGAAIFASGWFGGGPLDKETVFVVPKGASLGRVADRLASAGAIGSVSSFKLRQKFFGSDDPIKAGEFLLPAGASPATILETLQHGDVIRRFVTIPEGLPSILVRERLMDEPLLKGDIPVPAEGSILPESYDFERGEPRAAVVERMQAAMASTLNELWTKRAKDLVVKTPQEALTLASIVEKETALPRERRMVAGLYSNRLKDGMMLQADPTIIYPITMGKPLGRRIRQSEIGAINGYNTYAMIGLPKGPITNPGRASIAAVLHPAATQARYMVANGSKGHAFAATLAEHNANVAKWFALRRQRGEM